MKLISLLLFLFFFLETSNCQDSLINEIKKVDEVHFSAVGVGGVMSKQYRRYLTLKETSSIDELLLLLKNKSPVIKSYAAWALIDKKYSNLSGIFQEFLAKDKEVKIFMGCIKDKSNISHVFYHKYWASLKLDEKENDITLFKLDSIILVKSKAYFLSYTLQNRLFPELFNLKIELLAFKKLNLHALFYLSNWYKAKYKSKLRKALTRVLEKTKFATIGTHTYYKIIAELLKIRDSKTESIIIAKLKKDDTWKREKQRFQYLLNEYNIYLDY